MTVGAMIGAKASAMIDRYEANCTRRVIVGLELRNNFARLHCSGGHQHHKLSVAGTMDIAIPVLLARLPRSSKSDAVTSFGPVYSVRDSVKKRRKEICSATDGNSLSVYEVRLQQSL
jgi:hypothetical protein